MMWHMVIVVIIVHLTFSFIQVSLIEAEHLFIQQNPVCSVYTVTIASHSVIISYNYNCVNYQIKKFDKIVTSVSHGVRSLLFSI